VQAIFYIIYNGWRGAWGAEKGVEMEPRVMQKSLFRQEAMDKTLSPDELDRLMRVTGPKGWLALIALLALVAAAVVWGVFGTIPVVVGADEGVLLGGDSRSQAASNPGGPPTDGGGTPERRQHIAGFSALTMDQAWEAARMAGRIVQSGTYEELMEREGPFRDLAARQIA
jgi:HlyD family secretion protein